MINPVRPEAGGHEYNVPVSGDATSVRLLVYVPGYEMVAHVFTRADLETTVTFAPDLSTLPTRRLEGRLLDSSGRPLAGRPLTVKYRLVEAMQFLGYRDGAVLQLPIASARTDAQGAFAFDLPAFAEDPFLAEYRHDHSGFTLSTEDNHTLEPSTIDPSTKDSTLVVVQRTKGTLRGRLSTSFLEEHGISGDLAPLLRPMFCGSPRVGLAAQREGEPTVYNAMLKADGTFDVQLQAGEYRLVLRVSDCEGKTLREIPVYDGLIVLEDRLHIVER